jgi:ectoine hydroxylase-related dioxygenase (phytanoyl-CoA dioxygenase family)
MVKGSFHLNSCIHPVDWAFSIDVPDNDIPITNGTFVSSTSYSGTNEDDGCDNNCKTNEDDGCDGRSDVPEECIRIFERDGFVVFPEPVLSKEVVAELNRRLEEILRGRYTRQVPPDKAPRIFKTEYEGSQHIRDTTSHNNSNQNLSREERIKMTRNKTTIVGPIGFSGNYNNVRVIQVINVHKADHLFRRVAMDPMLGKVVAKLTGWKCGARLAQDQIWAKPPKAAPLAFHRDSPYFMFRPADVVTVWLALDDMTEELGPLKYVKGSHLWGEGRIGTASQFFESDGGIDLLHSAAERSNNNGIITPQDWMDDLEIVSMAGLSAGCVSIHNGRTWHGSGPNQSRTRPRRGLGLHFIPANARFTAEAFYSQLWRPYVEEALASGKDPAAIILGNDDFPVTWQESNGKIER